MCDQKTSRRNSACMRNSDKPEVSLSFSADPMSLNLYTPADGLYSTHVTWEDIEEDMQRELDSVAWLVPTKR
ncbi:hypothetical protein COOONC_20871 [Cooperia oncophora]